MVSSFLKYLDNYEEKGNDVLFTLKNYPTSKLKGNKIVRELYIYLFHDESLQLNRIHKIDDLIYKIEKIQQYFCLNCKTPIFFEENSNYITTCEFCNWRNELNDTPAISPIVLKSKDLEDYGVQICYPMLEREWIQHLPEKLGEAVKTWFKNRREFSKEMYQNIYHNLYKKERKKLNRRIEILNAKIKFAEFFQNSREFI